MVLDSGGGGSLVKMSWYVGPANSLRALWASGSLDVEGRLVNRWRLGLGGAEAMLWSRSCWIVLKVVSR